MKSSHQFRAVLALLTLAAVTFWLAPLAIGMALGWGDTLTFTRYDAGFAVATTIILALEAGGRALEVFRPEKKGRANSR